MCNELNAPIIYLFAAYLRIFLKFPATAIVLFLASRYKRLIDGLNWWIGVGRKFSMSVVLKALSFAFCAACIAGAATPQVAAQVQILAPELAMPGLDRTRAVRVYLPPSYAKSRRAYPVLYMHDGQNVFDELTEDMRTWGVDQSLNALAKSDGLELIVVGIEHGGVQRMNEMNPWKRSRFGDAEGQAYMDFIVKTVKPLIDQRFRTLPDRAHTAIMGSSMGGLISHYAIHQYRDTFSKAGIFSPSYWFSTGAYEIVPKMPLPAGTRLYMLVGAKEGSGMTRDFFRMVDLLGLVNGQLIELSYRLNPEGVHSEILWREEFPAAVRCLFRP
jgi:predicted alpha/beta superfamily hydrolase